MVVLTRAQRCRRAFQDTMENPCVLSLIARKLDIQDLVCLKQVSKDFRFNDVIQQRLTQIHQEDIRIKQVIGDLHKRVRELSDIASGEARIPTIVYIFDTVCENKWLLDFGKIKNMLYTKLIEFTKDPLFREHGVKYFTPLFGLKAPHTYYNSKLGRAQFGTMDTNGAFINLKNQ